MLFEKILYFCRKKAASQQSEQAPLRSVCTFFACEGCLFSESADRLHNGFLLLHPDCNSVDIVHEMMDNARHLQPEDLHQSVTYPGEGFDENQNTFILMWNPDISSVTLDDHRYGIAHMLTEYFNWSVWDHEKAKCGDRFYVE